MRWEETPEDDDPFGSILEKRNEISSNKPLAHAATSNFDNANAFDIQRTRTSTLAINSQKALIPDEIKLEIPANETPEEKKEREKAERKARMEANRLKKAPSLKPEAKIAPAKAPAAAPKVV